MAAADNQPPPAPVHREARADTTDRNPRVGEQRRPFNSGELGYTYTIYRFYDAADRLLYLGESGRVRQRIVDLEIGHPRGLPLGHDDGPKPWWREAVRIELQHLPPGTTETEARAEEGRQIELERPVYNRRPDGSFDRERQDQALEHAHFESEVATVEHERHDGLVRDLSQIDIESRRTADQLRPDGGALLDAIARQGDGRSRQARSAGDQQPAGQARPSGTQEATDSSGAAGHPGWDSTAEMTTVHYADDPANEELQVLEAQTAPMTRPRPIQTFYPTHARGNGPGSRLGLVVVAVVLALAVVAALVFSLQAAF